MIKVFIWRYYIENYIRNVVWKYVYMIFKKIWIWIKGIFDFVVLLVWDLKCG